jgi:hypothetical protein
MSYRVCPGGQVVGIDYDAAIIDEARRRTWQAAHCGRRRASVPEPILRCLPLRASVATRARCTCDHLRGRSRDQTWWARRRRRHRMGNLIDRRARRASVRALHRGQPLQRVRGPATVEAVQRTWADGLRDRNLADRVDQLFSPVPTLVCYDSSPATTRLTRPKQRAAGLPAAA